MKNDSEATQHVGPAQRVHAIVLRLNSAGGNQQASVVWQEALGITDRGEPRLFNDLAEFNGQLDLVKQQLVESQRPKELYAGAIKHVKTLASLNALHNSWNSLKSGHLGPDVMMAWAWIAHELPRDEAVISPETLGALRQQLGELESLLGDAGLSVYLRDFIERRVEAIREALDAYDIEGVEPLEAAYRDLTGAIQTNKEALKGEIERDTSGKAKRAFQMVKNAFEGLARACDSAEKIRKGIAIAAPAAPIAAELVRLITA